MTTGTRTSLELDSIDDYLGPASGRFFGAGYQRIGYDLRADVPTSRGIDNCELSATASLTYPGDWSRKAAGDQKPHLSTIDALALGASMAGLCNDALMSRSNGDFLTGEMAPGTAWIKSMRIRAGNKPHEDMAKVPVTSQAQLHYPDRGNIRSTHTARVAGMTVSSEVMHPVTAPSIEQTSGARSGNGSELYLDRLREHEVTISDVKVNPERSVTEATVTIRDNDTPAPSSCLEGAYQASTSAVDAFVTALQLGQVLLYELDNITRADSNTLWMRQTDIDAAKPHRPHVQPLRTTTWLENAKLIERKGEVWRTADIVGDVAAIRIRCAVAHQVG